MFDLNPRSTCVAVVKAENCIIKTRQVQWKACTNDISPEDLFWLSPGSLVPLDVVKLMEFNSSSG